MKALDTPDRITKEELDILPNNFQSLRWLLNGWFESTSPEDKMNLLYSVQEKVYKLINEIEYHRSLENK